MTKLTASLLAAAAVSLPLIGLAAPHDHHGMAGDSSAVKVSATKARAPRVVQMTISDDGVSPMEIKASKDEPIRLAITRTTNSTCITAIVVKDQGIDQAIPLNQTVNVDLTPKQPGKVRLACGMGMTFAILAVQ